MTTPATVELAVPGVYDIPEDAYHADPIPRGSLSSTELRRILDAPAKYRWHKTHGSEENRYFDFGKAAHAQLLGSGPDLEIVDAADWRTKAARDAQEAARAAGRVPVLQREAETVTGMVAAVRSHPIAGRLLDPDRGTPEQSLFWEGRHGITCRARLDVLPDIERTELHPFGGDLVRTKRMIVPEYKTTKNAAPAQFARSVANFGYHIQANWYLAGIRAIYGLEDAALVFIAQEKTPPYLVAVYELDPLALKIGADACRRAVDIYAECTAAGYWPGYSDDVQPVALPRWAEALYEQETTDDTPW